MKIRPVLSSDLSDLVSIFRDCWNISYRDLISSEVRAEMSVKKATELLLNVANPKPGRFTLIASNGSDTTGFASFGSDSEDISKGHLFSLYVAPNSAREGIGSKLLTEVIAELTVMARREITLWVFKDNRDAIGLYRKFGFIETGREKIDERWQIPQIEFFRNLITR